MDIRRFPISETELIHRDGAKLDKALVSVIAILCGI